MSDSVWPHRRQPTRLPCPWDSPGKNAEVGCHFLLQCMKVKGKSLSRVRLFVTPWTVAYQAPLSMGFSRQEYWSGLLFPSPIDYVSIQKYTVDLWTGMLELTGLLTYIFFSIVNTMKLRNPWLVESKDTEESQIWRNKKQADFLQADFLLQRGSVAPTSTLFKCMVY